MNQEQQLRISFKKYLLEQGIQLIDLDEYAEKGIATFWLSKLSLERERIYDEMREDEEIL